MSGLSSAAIYSEASADVSASAFQHHQHHQHNRSIPSQPYCEGHMHNSLGTNRAFNRGEQSRNRTSTLDCAEWLANFFRATPAKVIANDAGINVRAAENVKQGRNGLTQAHLENLCNANPEFRAAWFAERCGGHLEVNPSQVAAIYRAINSITRGEWSE